MNRVIGVLTLVMIAALPAMQSRADILVGTIDFLGTLPTGLSRFDETIVPGPAPALTAGDINDFGIPTSAQFPLTPKPSDVAVAANGDLFVSDLLGRILRVDSPSEVFASYPSFQSDPTYTSLTFGPDGRLYATDSYDTDADPSTLEPGIRVYDPVSGNQVDTLFDDTPLFGLVTSVAFLPDGNLLLSALSAGIIYHADITSTPGQEVVTPFITSIDIDGEDGPDLFNPNGIALDSAGNIYVANMSGNNLIKFNPDGTGATLLATIRPDDPATVPSSFFLGNPLTHHPTDIVFDREGNLLVTLLGDLPVVIDEETMMLNPTNGGIVRYDTSGNLLQVLADDLLPVNGITLVDDLLPGDYDGNGTVEAADYVEWKSQLGSSVAPTTGADGNGDGLVDLADYTIWRNTLGDSGFTPAASINQLTGIPEPTTLVTLFFAIGLFRICRRSLT